MGLYLVDIDGTVAKRDESDPNVRSPFEWHRVGEDLPNEPVIEVVRALALTGHEIVYLSGRSDACRVETRSWLLQNVGPIGEFLFMRKDGDFRPDTVVKKELYEGRIVPFFGRATAVFDDRKSVVKMWREELGLTVLQVAEGDF